MCKSHIGSVQESRIKFSNVRYENKNYYEFLNSTY